MSGPDRTVRSVRLLISGGVQGVGYRAWLVGEAERQGVSGWVRNLGDGRVEAVLSGAASAVAAVAAACADGPALARVSGIEQVDAAPDDAGPGGGFGER